MMVTFMRRYEMMAVLGLIIVLFSFGLAYSAANHEAFWLAASKETRETAQAGSALVASKVVAEGLRSWVPAFKFTGLALMLGGITMALGLIVVNLRDLGTEFMRFWPQQLRAEVPKPPLTVMVFRMSMMLGVLIVIASLVVALQLLPTVESYWSHSIAAELDVAQPGSFLLAQLGFIRGQEAVITGLRFLGMAFLFTGIVLALTVIIRTLRYQEEALERFLAATRG